MTAGSSGAVSAFTGGGIALVHKESTAGQYTITFSDQFRRLLSVRGEMERATPSVVASVQLLMAPATLQATVISTKQIVIQCLDYAGAAVNPESGAVLNFVVVFRNSQIGPFDA